MFANVTESQRIVVGLIYRTRHRDNAIACVGLEREAQYSANHRRYGQCPRLRASRYQRACPTLGYGDSPGVAWVGDNVFGSGRTAYAEAGPASVVCDVAAFGCVAPVIGPGRRQDRRGCRRQL